MLKRFVLLFVSFIILLQLGCKKNDTLKSNTPAPTQEPPVITDDAIKVKATITGTVIDENNQPVSGAPVTSGTYAATTDAMGNFIIKDATISKANGNVTVVRQGYFKGIRSFVTADGNNNYVKIQLIKQVASGTVNAATGGMINTSGASINFPANAFVTETGAGYTGVVTVYAHWIDPTAANLPLLMPGDLRGIDSTNGEYILKSYGMVGAELKDYAGNTLKIAAGKTATISFSIPVSLQSAAPSTIPLWHFDETTARWKMEGSASKNGNTYTAAVNKFSFWNVDASFNYVQIDCRLVNNANNQPLAFTLVKITSLTTAVSAYGFTNANGYVSGYVPKNENLKLEVIAGIVCTGNTIVYTQNAGPYTTNTSLGNIAVTVPSGNVVHFTGKLLNCANQPLTNGYLSLNLSNGGNALVLADSSGNISFSLANCSSSNTYSYTAVDMTNGNYCSITTGSITGNTVNFGNINACGNTLNINGVYIAGAIGNNAVLWKDGIPQFLTNIPSTDISHTAGALQTVVEDNNVYTLGFEQYYNPQAYTSTTDIKIWKNGVASVIANTNPYHIQWTGFDVANGDVYVCGHSGATANHPNEAIVWKNGIKSVLPVDTFDYATPKNIKVINGDVYVAGMARVNSTNYMTKAVYWKNNQIYVLSNTGTYSTAEDISVNNGDVYVTGTEGSYSVYWKNGIKSILNFTGAYSESSSNSIYIDNTDIYTAGTFIYSAGGALWSSNAVYWKNRVPVLVTNYPNWSATAELLDIFVKNNSVYTVGKSLQASGGVKGYLYFQNTVPVLLTGFSSPQDVQVSGIFVK